MGLNKMQCLELYFKSIIFIKNKTYIFNNIRELNMEKNE